MNTEAKYSLEILDVFSPQVNVTTHRASAGSVAGWRGGVGTNLCGSASS